jgi:hypothetical protein
VSWKPEVLVDGKWTPNDLAFTSEVEARLWAADLLGRWWVPTDSRAVESEQEVNYLRLDDGSLKEVK